LKLNQLEEQNFISKKRKRERIKINNLCDFKDALKKEGYKINEERFKEDIARTFKVDNSVIEYLYTCISEGNITYRADDVQDFIDYIKKMISFENEQNKLWKKISTINTLIIDRIEYDRVPSTQDDIKDMIDIIEKIANDISEVISEEEKVILEESEKEIGMRYLYAKDIELLKKMVIVNNRNVKETYNSETKTKTISIIIPEKLNYHYIKAKKGTVEYHEYLSNNIPRMQRLINNIDKYLKVDEEEKTTFIINQSKALQDSINIVVAIYDNKEFRAISGSDEIINYCSAPQKDEANFKSSKVNKLGKLGVGYNRVNDAEKKILEEIHKQIEKKVLKNEGNLAIYSKWEPCPSCYYVMDQFMKKHPYIKIQVKYLKKYGE
jgi:hypothetical protein